MFEYTEKPIAHRFEGRFNALRDFPTLFMSEGVGDEVARIGTVTGILVSGGDVSISYAYDAEMPHLLNSQIYKLSAQLGIHDWEFSRTHWAVKDVDMFRVLFRGFQPVRNLPVVFRISDPPSIDRKLVSAMMPFHTDFSPVYEIIRSSCESLKLTCNRADDIWQNATVIQDVVALIDRSWIVVCDCTGRNPNVFYEAGIAHTLGREVVFITQSERDIPFDLRHLRYVPYLNNSEGRLALAEQLKSRFCYLLGL
jgi:hypothetical protein